jgi:hypothetical protein
LIVIPPGRQQLVEKAKNLPHEMNYALPLDLRLSVLEFLF